VIRDLSPFGVLFRIALLYRLEFRELLFLL